MNHARKQGLFSFRSAGSHSKVDVCIIDPAKKKIVFIQAKAGQSKLTNKELQEFQGLSNEYSVAFIQIRKAKEIKEIIK